MNQLGFEARGTGFAEYLVPRITSRYQMEVEVARLHSNVFTKKIENEERNGLPHQI